MMNRPVAVSMGLGLDRESGRDERSVLMEHENDFQHTAEIMSIDEGIHEILASFEYPRSGSTETDSKDIYSMISSSALENVTLPEHIKDLLKEAKLTQNDINMHISTTSRPPFHPKETHSLTIENSTSRTFTSQDLSQAAVQGAALQASILSDPANNVDICTMPLDVTRAFLSISLFNSSRAIIIPRYNVIPVRRSVQFMTASDGQEDLRFDVFEGETEMAGENRYLGTIKMKDIMALPKGEGRFVVTFEIDLDYRLQVMVEEKMSGRKETVKIEEKIYDGSYDPFQNDGTGIEGGERAKMAPMRSMKENEDGLEIVCDGEDAWFEVETGMCKATVRKV